MEDEKIIHDRMITNISDDYDKSKGNFVYDITKPVAVEFAEQQKKIAAVQEKLDVEKLTGDELTRTVYQRTGIIRKPATQATTTVIVSGTAGTLVKVGELVGTETILYTVIEEAILNESGFAHVRIQCNEFGQVGNVPANTIVNFPASINGLVNVYNPDPVVDGYDEETDNDLRQRYYDKLQRPGKAGNKYHYREWALEVTGVGDAKIFPRYNGPLSMKVVVIDANKLPANVELIEAVRDHIEEEMPFGVDDLLIISAEALLIDLSVALSLMPGYTEEVAKANIKKNITKHLKEIAFRTSFVSYAKIGALIIESDGVLDYQDLLINGSTANVVIPDDGVPVMGGVNE
ncbi:baseplate J/gp47 family protein [Lysinibacillus capsici]|uniref:baseplate J/gp47 family protein n=1 Tax=Lysinibacillus capsici TaxID=2115968 RepID=UPI00272F6D20|nr:baseplate J/gp47 family protein [Lysinibacillus capsici]MDP1394760.1 baseplate J/gp47 family protein [Lysinibacillus capsici]MDP1415179.1 baseplate J/gp47 family protein [Lysinibacillus capsici]MDP1431123.1 baseplate J/gp47 family protein [Lysinibacillus capsici]